MKKVKAVRKGRSINKGDLCAELETSTGVAKRDGMKILKGIEEALPELLKKTGKVTIPGIARRHEDPQGHRGGPARTPEEDRQGDHPGHRARRDPPQEGDQGREEDDVRPGGEGQ